MTCNRLVMEVKQGESRGFNFTINQRIFNANNNEWVVEPFNLSNLTVLFQVKMSPYFNLPSLIEKEITETSDQEHTGWIHNPTQGQFQVIITEEEANRPPYDYYIIVTVLDNTTKYIISGEGNTSGIFRVCKQ